MTDFRPIILTNLSIFPGIVEEPDVVDSANGILNHLQDVGLGRLVSKFCSYRKSPDQARDFLFEAWVGWHLARDIRVTQLRYEPPPEEEHPPDFRFMIGEVSFDVEVKRLYNVKNQRLLRVFRQELRTRLFKARKPWIIDLWLSETFEWRHMDGFCRHVIQSADGFETELPEERSPLHWSYKWPEHGRALVRFSFRKREVGALGMSLGFMSVGGTDGGGAQLIDPSIVRSSVNDRLGDASESLTRSASPVQANIVVLQPIWDFRLDERVMSDVLWGDELTLVGKTADGEVVQCGSERKTNGLLRPDKFSKICGVVLVPSSVMPTDAKFSGTYFWHPSHADSIEQHPKPFEDMLFARDGQWMGDTQ